MTEQERDKKCVNVEEYLQVTEYAVGCFADVARKSTGTVWMNTIFLGW